MIILIFIKKYIKYIYIYKLKVHELLIILNILDLKLSIFFSINNFEYPIL